MTVAAPKRPTTMPAASLASRAASGMVAPAAIASASVAITVSDCGGGMRDVSDEPGLGAGISIMGRVADALRIAPEPVGPGTRLWMLFRHAAPDPGPLGELLHDGVPAPCDADVLQEYVEALQAGAAPFDDAFAMLDEARRALEHAKRLRRRGWVQ